MGYPRIDVMHAYFVRHGEMVGDDAATRRDAATAGLGALLVGGVFTDGWAHFNRPGLETFFTPWHAVLYSSLGVMVAWLAVVAWRASGGNPKRIVTTLPRGYGLAVVGAIVFGAGGMGDLVWHQLFGIEIAIDALLSPTHLMLGAGGLLILSTAMRAQGLLGDSREGEWTVPARLSLTLTLALVVFFLLYVSAFAQPGPLEAFTPTPESEPGHEAAELPVIAALAAYLLTTMIITLPLLVTMRGTGRAPRGAAILIVAAVAVLPVLVMDLPPAPLAGAVGALVGALVWELTAPAAQARMPHRTAAWAAPAALIFLIWSGHLAGLALADAVRWPVPLWSGTVVLATLLAAIAGFTAQSRREVAQ